MKRYAFKTKTTADKYINELMPKDENGNPLFTTVTDKIQGIMVWGFEKTLIPQLDANGANILDSKGLPIYDIITSPTYNVDVVWKGEQPTKWDTYEINPKTPNHKLA